MTGRFTKDENAVSISVGTMLMFGVTVITLIVVINSFYTMMDRETSIVTRNQFEIHGNDMALQISNIDTAVQIARNHGGTAGNISYQFSLPPTIANKQYSIEIENTTNEIIFEAETQHNSIVKVPYVTNEVNISSVKMYSGKDTFEFVYDPQSNMIELQTAE